MALPSYGALLYRQYRIDKKLARLDTASTIASVRGQVIALRREAEKTARLIKIYRKRIR